MDSHDGHNLPHPKTSYGLAEGGGPTVAGEEKGHNNGDKEQTLSATVAPNVGPPCLGAGGKLYEDTLRRDTGYMSWGYPDRLQLLTLSDFTGARGRVQPAHRVDDDAYFASGDQVMDAKNVTFRGARQKRRESRRITSNSSADSSDDAHTETVCKPKPVVMVMAGRPATSPATPRQFEVAGSVARLRPAQTCPTQDRT